LTRGVRAAAIDDRVRSGRLRVWHPGVYFVGHGPLSRVQLHLAAVLACGARSFSGRDSAAELWRLLAAHPGAVVRGPQRTAQEGAGPRHGAPHRPPSAHETTAHRGVPITTPARTLLDLAASGHPGLERALDEALARRLVTRAELETLAASGRRGSACLRGLIQDTAGYTREGAERLLRSLILKARLPRPQFNARVLGHERDAFWPEHRLVLEVDGYAAHGTRAAFEADRRRDQDLVAAGYAPSGSPGASSSSSPKRSSPVLPPRWPGDERSRR